MIFLKFSGGTKKYYDGNASNNVTNGRTIKRGCAVAHPLYSITSKDYMAKVLKPPSTTATVPVTKAAASLMRYWMVPHNSSGRPKRLNGV